MIKYLKSPFVLGLVGGLAMVMMLYLDDYSNESETDFKDYFKLFLTSAIVVVSSIYLYKFSNSGIFSSFSVPSFSGGSMMPSTDAYSGIPDF